MDNLAPLAGRNLPSATKFGEIHDVGKRRGPNDICHRERDIGSTRTSRTGSHENTGTPPTADLSLTIARDETRRRRTEFFRLRLPAVASRDVKDGASGSHRLKLDLILNKVTSV